MDCDAISNPFIEFRDDQICSKVLETPTSAVGGLSYLETFIVDILTLNIFHDFSLRIQDSLIPFLIFGIAASLIQIIIIILRYIAFRILSFTLLPMIGTFVDSSSFIEFIGLPKVFNPPSQDSSFVQRLSWELNRSFTQFSINEFVFS